MSFQFRFRVLLQHRQHRVKKAQTDLATAQQEYSRVQWQRGQIQEQILQQKQLWEEKQLEGMNIGDFLAFGNYVQSLEQQLLGVNKELQRARQLVEKLQGLLVDREKEVKTLETLEERDKETYRYLEAKREKKHLDEVAVFGDFHKKSKA